MRTLPYKLTVLLAVTAVTSFGSLNRGIADPATDRTQKLVSAFKKVKSGDEGKKLSAADRKANEAVYKELDRLFSFDEFGDACLGPAKDTLDKKQARDFRDRLIDILRRQGYANAGAAFKEGELKYGKPRQDKGRTIVPLAINFPKQDLSMTVDFVWGPGDRVVDLIVDDDSLTQDLSNQIARILKKSGPDDLAKRLAEKQAELDKENL